MVIEYATVSRPPPDSTHPPAILPQYAQSGLRNLARRCLLDGQVGIDEVAAPSARRAAVPPTPREARGGS